MFGSWIVDDVPSGPSCVVLTDPTSDSKKCGNPATTGRTVLDLPICESCFEGVSSAR